MQRLAALDHDVVGNIDKVVEGADAGRLQAPAHPGRRKSNPYPSHHSRCITRAQIRIFDSHAGLLRNRYSTLAHLGFLGMQQGASEGSNFSGESEDAESVTPIGGNR